MRAGAALALASPVAALPGIGPGRAGSLARAGLRTVGDLLRLLPRGLEAPARPATAGDLAAPAAAGASRLRLRVRVLGLSLWPPRGRRAVLTLRLESLAPPGVRLKAFYFNQPYLKSKFALGQELELEGRLVDKSGPALIAPRCVEAGAARSQPAPFYPEIEGVPAEVLRKALLAALPALEELPDPLAAELRARADLPALAEAWRAMHAPQDLAHFERGRRRLAFDEVVRAERAHRAELAAAGPPPRAIAPAVWERIRARLPFPLNAEQEAVLAVVRAEWARGARVQRLLHGEVGSGKTAVAFAMALAIAADGGQAALLAPTEILARQHLERFRAWLAGARLPVCGLLGDDAPSARRAVRARLARREPLLAVGTHALLAPEIRFGALRLVVFDEQHRFGVRQKAQLLAKGHAPHVLTMTATPIPRTLAWARYGAIATSVLRARAGAGAPITTRVLPASAWCEEAALLRPRLAAGERAFFVAPRVDGPDGLLARAAILRDGAWRGLPLALVHGRMPGSAVAAELARFTRGEARVLCGTTEVEVGLDVPGDEHMMVVGAERLGLASLHQLRGRLARGAAASAGRCLFFCAPERLERLRLLEHCVDGFQVAEEDLAERGPGSLRGTRQHGVAGFRLFDPARDADLVALASGVTAPAPSD